MFAPTFSTPSAGVTVDTTAMSGSAAGILTVLGNVIAQPGVRTGGQVCSVEIENAGAVALSAFAIYLQDHPDGEWYQYLAGTDFDSTTNANMMFCTTTGPHELGAGGKAHVHFRHNGAYGIKFEGQTGSSSTTVKIRGHFNPA